jgi:hypothetical protein
MIENKILRTTLIIFYTLFAGQIVFLTISLFSVSSSAIKVNPQLFILFAIVVLLITAPLLVTGPIIYRKLISKQMDKLKSIEEKLISYRQGTIIKLAFVESASMLSIFSFFITGAYLFFIFALLILLLFFLHKPSLEKFASDFNIDLSELETHLKN